MHNVLIALTLSHQFKYKCLPGELGALGKVPWSWTFDVEASPSSGAKKNIKLLQLCIITGKLKHHNHGELANKHELM